MKTNLLIDRLHHGLKGNETFGNLYIMMSFSVRIIYLDPTLM